MGTKMKTIELRDFDYDLKEIVITYEDCIVSYIADNVTQYEDDLAKIIRGCDPLLENWEGINKIAISKR